MPTKEGGLACILPEMMDVSVAVPSVVDLIIRGEVKKGSQMAAVVACKTLMGSFSIIFSTPLTVLVNLRSLEPGEKTRGLL